MKKIKAGSYSDTHLGVNYMVSKCEQPYTSQRGFKAKHTGWGFILETDQNPSLAPAFSSRKAAQGAAKRAIEYAAKCAAKQALDANA